MLQGNVTYCMSAKNGNRELKNTEVTETYGV